MDEQQAHGILSALANGVDPSTGEVFARDSPYQTPEVVRALFVAVRAIEQGVQPSAGQSEVQARGKNESKPARNAGANNAGKPWTVEEDQRLLAAFDRGESARALATAHARTLAGIEARLERHGRIASTQRVTANRYAEGARARGGVD